MINLYSKTINQVFYKKSDYYDWRLFFPQIGASDFIFSFSHQQGLKIKKQLLHLGIELKENVSRLSGSSVVAKLEILDQEQNSLRKDELYFLLIEGFLDQLYLMLLFDWATIINSMKI